MRSLGRRLGHAMSRKITAEVLEDYIDCEYTAHLRLVGQRGTRTGYEAMRLELR